MIDNPVLVRVVAGIIGGRHPEDGTLMLVSADVAAALIDCGEAVRVTFPDPTIVAPAASVRDGDGKVMQTTPARPA